MSSDWEPTTLGSVCDRQGGSIQTGPFGSQLHASDYVEQGIPVVMPANIGSDGGISEDGIARITQFDADRLQQHKLQVGDVVFSRRGDVTRNALIEAHQAGWLCGTGCLKVRLGSQTQASAKFISYCLRLPETKDWLVRHAVGATMPNLNTSILSAVPILLPELPVQQSIANILGCLDERIDLLRETNATLEAIVQALFKSWFVDFDPVHARARGEQLAGLAPEVAALFPNSFEESELGMVPKGWKFGHIYDAATVIYGAPFASKRFNTERKGLPLIRIRDLKNETPGVYTDEVHPKGYLTQPGDIVVGMDGEFRAYLWGGQPAWLNQRVCVFKPISGHSSAFIHYTIKPQLAAVEATEIATTVIHLGKNDIDRFSALIPDVGVIRAFSDVANPFYAQIIENKQKAQTLANLRDTLLPRLISGQLRLPDTEQQLKDLAV
ncbi:restriction endonuclease subunit S [Aeromonas dhakensis]|uniref:restriction endonuclease subunit S n=1 Tax=Aeromonas dhakensis TaxID=196024 RepID=UPI003988565E